MQTDDADRHDVKAMDFRRIPFVIAAKSHDDGKQGGILIWKKNAVRGEPEWGMKGQSMSWWWVLQTAMVIASVAFVCQNLGISYSILSLSGKARLRT